MKNKKPKIKFTGERLVPELNKGYAFFYEHLARYLFSCQFARDKSVLDAGCGVGYGSFIIATYGKAKKVSGVDLSTEAIEYAKQKYPISNINFNQDNIEEIISLANNSIDIALAFEVIEHVKKENQLLKSIKNKLKSNGIFVVSTPNKNTYPKGNPYHVREYYPKDFINLLKNHFMFVKIFHQCFEFTQNIKEEPKKVFTFEEKFSESSKKIFSPPLDIKNSQYLIAVCSDNRLPVIDTVAINSYMIDGFDLHRGLLSLIEQHQRLKDQVGVLNREVINYQSLINQLEKELLEIKSSKTFKLRKFYHDKRGLLKFNNH